jgi:excisionase family DNA binding protein
MKDQEKSDVVVSSMAVDLHVAARLLNVSVKTVRREINRRKLRALQIGRIWRVRVSEIDAYLKRLEGLAMGGAV